MGRIRVAVTGAYGKMGREVLKAVHNEGDMVLVGAVDPFHVGENVGRLIGQDLDLNIQEDLSEVIEEARPDVLVDFTSPKVAGDNIKTALNHGVYPVVGTTGIPKAELAEIESICLQRGMGAVIVPNFSLGILLMKRFIADAAKFFPDVEIIELHHNQKLDAPSGTSLQLAERITGGNPDKKPPIHSVRLPGLVAHHEVIFGGIGQVLTIRHDSINRESFMPGVIMAIRKVTGLKRVVYDLEELIG